MKKYFYTAFLALTLTNVNFGQNTNTTTPAATPEQENFDRNWRFGLRVTPQISWFSSNEKNNLPAGAKVGFGFGLNVERRLSNIVSFLFGIGGDFEGAKYKFRFDDTPNSFYVPTYFIDKSTGEFVTPKENGKGDGSELANEKNTGYVLKERTVKTTHVTIPLLLKLNTREYSGMRYFGMFGVDLGIRVRHIATDSYRSATTFSSNGLPTKKDNPESIENLNLGNSEGSAVPMRIGLNVGAGTEFRIGGSTAAFVSVNYFRAFTNQFGKNSDVMFYGSTTENGTISYQYVKQNYILNAVRLNIGIMF